MELYLVRHGDAGRGLPGAGADAARELTPEGRKASRGTAKALRALGCRPDLIITSPLPRALQTAGIIAAALGPGKVKKSSLLAPGSAPAAFFRWLSGAGADVVLAAGHMPHLGALAAAAIGPGGAELEFRKSGVCLISFDGSPGAGRGKLQWLLQPGQLKALKKAWKK